MKTYEYDTALHLVPEKGGAYVIFPWNIREEFGKGRVNLPRLKPRASLTSASKEAEEK